VSVAQESSISMTTALRTVRTTCGAHSGGKQNQTPWFRLVY